ncbi:MAG: formate--tetrahydrofolate ligase [Planctomycetaceae bacterium]|nr:formate--tetrahydrofolate ligase [Planctomycetaceae bacterium]
MPLDSDVRIARQARMRPILEIAADLGLPAFVLELHGPYKAKVRLEALAELGPPRAKIVVVTAMTPTPLGEGKTVNTIGLALGLNRIGKRTVCALRQPSLGPFFGVKGGAAGGGRSQVLPMDDINLRLTGDIDAVAAAHNLLASLVDNHLFHGNPSGLDLDSITWTRCLDMNDRALRKIRISVGEKTERATQFDIAVASEAMAILALATSYKDLRARLGRIIVGRTKSGTPVTAGDLKAAGAMAVLLRDAFKPNLLQTIENTPAFIHAGPFGNIAHGNSSVIADQIAVRCTDYVVTESGFGADLGFEKFIDIKCRASGLRPSAAMIVATIRACKLHGGDYDVKTGRPLPKELLKENVEAVERGTANLAHMIGIVKRAGLPAVVAINRFPDDTDREIDAVRAAARKAGAAGVELIEAYARGGEGAVEVARAVAAACETPSDARPFYDVAKPIRQKIEAIARDVYGADGVDYSARAQEEIDRYTAWGLGALPICMAKTQLSISHDPKRRGVPKGFRVPIQQVRASAGAGFLYPLLGDIMTMPGLPSEPASAHMDIDDQGNLIGLNE